ncbi:MAG: LysR family transcriptional regulator substrate-binding protein [Acetobacteraceae bacterium]
MHGRRLIAASEHGASPRCVSIEGATGRVHIGAGPTALVYLLPPALRRLRDEHPGIEIAVTSGTTHSIAEGSLSHVLDIGFTALPVEANGIDAVPYAPIRWLPSYPRRMRESLKRLTPADVAGRTPILEHCHAPHRQLSRAWLDAGGVTVRPALEFDSIEAIKAAVAAIRAWPSCRGRP